MAEFGKLYGKDIRDRQSEALLLDNAPKNLLILRLDEIKALNTSGTWTDNVYTLNNVDFTVTTNAAGYVTSITTSGQASGRTDMYLAKKAKLWSILESYVGDKVYITGCPQGGSSPNGYWISLQGLTQDGIGVADTGSGNLSNTIVDFSAFNTVQTYIAVAANIDTTGLTFYPMVRLEAVTDPTFEVSYRNQKDIDAALRSVEAWKNGLINGEEVQY